MIQFNSNMILTKCKWRCKTRSICYLYKCCIYPCFTNIILQVCVCVCICFGKSHSWNSETTLSFQIQNDENDDNHYIDHLTIDNWNLNTLIKMEKKKDVHIENISIVVGYALFSKFKFYQQQLKWKTNYCCSRLDWLIETKDQTELNPEQQQQQQKKSLNHVCVLYLLMIIIILWYICVMTLNNNEQNQ